MKRRAIVSLVGVGAIGPLAGCLGFVRGVEPLEFEASPVGVRAAALRETGYAFDALNDVLLEREYEVRDRSRRVEVRNKQAEYDREISFDAIGSVKGAVFSAVATPSVSVLGREFNPLGGMDTDELVEMVQGRFEGIQDVTRVGTTERDVGGTSVPVGRYEAEADLFGRTIDIHIHISEAVDVGDDLVIAAGVYPASISDEATKVRRLMEGLDPDASLGT